MSHESHLHAALADLLDRLQPGTVVESVVPLGADPDQTGDATEKGIGYGKPLRVRVRDAGGARRDLVLHTELPNQFGHDRRADRAADMLLAHDTAASIPRHAPVLDVGAIGTDGHLYSLRGTGEFYLLTEWVPGVPYIEDLRRAARDLRIDTRDRTRCQMLAHYLADLHTPLEAPAAVYTRAIRDLVGHGEGIYGIVDGYPPDTPSAPASRLAAIERAAAAYRWRLRGREDRLRRTHGDFHPFNILFDDRDTLSVLDASRGCRGDAADDLTCLTINYVFLALESEGAWAAGLGELHDTVWRLYLDATGDQALLESAPPYLAWRALVVCNPTWYPNLHAGVRDAMLGLAERALAAGRYQPEWAAELFS